jgi:hypothetical protein
MRPVAQSPVVSSAHPTARSAALALGVFVYFVYSQSRDLADMVPWESRLLRSQIMGIIEISV